jgi:hypothetical protein
LEITATDGKVYKTKHYNLDAIIAVGYRINSQMITDIADDGRPCGQARDTVVVYVNGVVLVQRVGTHAEYSKWKL